jgi:DNA-binding NarL/FixJ family response regulator
VNSEKQNPSITTVMVIDDDPDFQHVLTEVFNADDQFEVIGSFSTLEAFTDSIPENHAEAQQYLADLLVIDVMSSGAQIGAGISTDGATVATFLRQSGLDFSILLLSSMKSHHFELYGHRKNWEFLPKSSRLTPETILQSARLALGLA